MALTNTPLLWRDLRFDNADVEVYAPKPASLLLAKVATGRIKPCEQVLDACTGSVVTVADLVEPALETARSNAATDGGDEGSALWCARSWQPSPCCGRGSLLLLLPH
jgi:methylase of polypeptide subunit release factors